MKNGDETFPKNMIATTASPTQLPPPHQSTFTTGRQMISRCESEISTCQSEISNCKSFGLAHDEGSESVSVGETFGEQF